MNQIPSECWRVNREIKRLNLKWEEYDFGDTLYARVPIFILAKKTSIVGSCETESYKIQFGKDGYALIFMEMKQNSLVEEVLQWLSRINLLLLRQKYSYLKSER